MQLAQEAKTPEAEQRMAHLHRLDNQYQTPTLPETYSFISRDHIEHVALCIEVLFGLGWRDIPVKLTFRNRIRF